MVFELSDLFQQERVDPGSSVAPLATRVRPLTLEHFQGQEHILGQGKLLRRAIDADKVGSIILYGPPGSGKTTLARIITTVTQSHFVRMSAVTSNVAQLRKVFAEAELRLKNNGRRTILFIDEIHRFNKAQQDVLLPCMETAVVSLIGTTTHNPFFYLTSPLISRARVFKLEALKDKDLRSIIKRTLRDKDKGLGEYRVELQPKALNHLIKVSEGDARKALNALEVAVLTTQPDARGMRKIDLGIVEEAIQKKAVVYDRDEDQHYDVISAFIKSMRGSDPDAALYWLAKMLYAGEDPRFIVRRMVIAAAEDVGNADPMALVVATAALSAVEFVGMPEAQIPLAQAVVYLATAPKSNASCTAIARAMKDVEKEKTLEVPKHLRDSNYYSAKAFASGEGYKYPHSYPGHIVDQQYMPRPRRYYEASDQGYEKEIAERIKLWKESLKSEEGSAGNGKSLRKKR